MELASDHTSESHAATSPTKTPIKMLSSDEQECLLHLPELQRPNSISQVSMDDSAKAYVNHFSN